MSEKKETAENQTNKASKSTKILLVVLIIVVVAAAAIIIYLLTRPSSEEQKNESDNGRGTVVSTDNVNSINLNEEIEDGYYTTRQNIDWHFNGKVSEDAYVANSTANKRTVYFDLSLQDTGEVIYSSPYIPVGSEMTGLSLDKELPSGKYETIMTYHLVDDDKKELSTLSVALDIYVD